MIRERKLGAMRGRAMIKQERSEYGKLIRKAYEGGYIKEPRANIQQFEFRKDGCSNTITTVEKDFLTIGKWVNDMNDERFDEEITEKENKPKVEDYLWKDYGVFKLSARECLRLMSVKDSDTDKILATVSKSQAYKQAGNSIVVSVLMAIFSQLNIKGVKMWNDMTEEERQTLVDTTRDYIPARMEG